MTQTLKIQPYDMLPPFHFALDEHEFIEAVMRHYKTDKVRIDHFGYVQMHYMNEYRDMTRDEILALGLPMQDDLADSFNALWQRKKS